MMDTALPAAAKTSRLGAAPPMPPATAAAQVQTLWLALMATSGLPPAAYNTMLMQLLGQALPTPPSPPNLPPFPPPGTPADKVSIVEPAPCATHAPSSHGCIASEANPSSLHLIYPNTNASQGNNGSRVALVVSLSVVLPVAAVAATLIAWYIWRGGSSSSGGQRGGLFRTASGKKRSRAPEVSSDTTLVVSVEEGD